jgi:hypothetical protein
MLKPPAVTLPPATLPANAISQPSTWPDWDQVEEKLTTCIQTLDDTQLYTQGHLTTLRKRYRKPGAQCQVQSQGDNYTQALESCKAVWEHIHDEYCRLRQRHATWHATCSAHPSADKGHKASSAPGCPLGPKPSEPADSSTMQITPTGHIPASAELVYKLNSLRMHIIAITLSVKANLAALAHALALMYAESAPKEDEPV